MIIYRGVERSLCSPGIKGLEGWPARQPTPELSAASSPVTCLRFSHESRREIQFRLFREGDFLPVAEITRAIQ